MNNKLRQGLIISTIVTLGLLGQVKEAIAQTLNDKNIDKTEELARITDNTASAINMNFDLDRSSPDASAVKQFFMGWDILNDEEKKDFEMLRNSVIQSDVRPIYERQILKFFNPVFTEEEKRMFIILLLDPNQNTQLWQKEFSKLNNKKSYKSIHTQSIRSVNTSIELAQSTEKLEQLKKEWEQLKKEWEQLKKEWEQLKSLKQTLENMKKVFEENQEK